MGYLSGRRGLARCPGRKCPVVERRDIRRAPEAGTAGKSRPGSRWLGCRVISGDDTVQVGGCDAGAFR
jgi:hypothetical protein